jgi:hypothetical protein
VVMSKINLLTNCRKRVGGCAVGLQSVIKNKVNGSKFSYSMNQIEVIDRQ